LQIIDDDTKKDNQIIVVTHSPKKIKLSFENSDIRSLLFSKSLVFVEGPCDKIVIRLIDSYLLIRNKGAKIEENEGYIEEDIINALRLLNNYLLLKIEFNKQKRN
jgi:predicted ATP-dependent endonuclease of OLD family